LTLETEPIINQVTVTEKKLIVELTDGRILSVPISWYPRLVYANQTERQKWEIIGNGYGIEWIDLDEHISIEGLLAGRRSGESQTSFVRWLKKRQ